jgi:uncharacterized protein (DUF58 family)
VARPTRKALAVSAGALLLFLIGSNIQAGWLYVLGASMLGVVMAGVLLPTFSIRNLQAARQVPDSASSGEPIHARLQLRNARGGAMEVSDTLFGESRFLLATAESASEVIFEYQVTPKRRGIYQSAEVRVRSGFPFGMGVAERKMRVGSPIVVHPKWVEVKSLPLLEAASTPNEPFHDRRRRGSGMDFFGVREYRAGDSLRHVHWKSVARAGRLVVREYEEQPASRLGIFIDTADVIGRDGETSLEDAVSCAASLAIYALSAGHPVQLFCDSIRGIQHLREPGTLDALDWLAGVEAGGARGMAAVAEHVADKIQARSTNIIIFPSTTRGAEEALRAIALLQGLSTRVITLVLSAGSYLSAPDLRVLTEAAEESLLQGLVGSHVLTYKVERGVALTECLSEPYHF